MSEPRCELCYQTIGDDNMVHCRDCGNNFHPKCMTSGEQENCPICDGQLWKIQDNGGGSTMKKWRLPLLRHLPIGEIDKDSYRIIGYQTWFTIPLIIIYFGLFRQNYYLVLLGFVALLPLKYRFREEGTPEILKSLIYMLSVLILFGAIITGGYLYFIPIVAVGLIFIKSASNTDDQY